MLKKMMILAVFLTLLTGCSRTAVYVLEEKELIRVKKDDSIKAEFDGWLLSDRAVDRVLNAKEKGANLK